MGDLNFDMLSDKKCQALKDLCDVLDQYQNFYNFCKLLFFFSGLGHPLLL
jgi:hypothetical protein